MNLHGRAVGRALKHMRTLAGLTQKDVSTALGYSSAQFISNWERGISTPPDETLGRLATLFQVKPTRLIDVIIDFELATLKARRRELVRITRRKP